MPKSLAQNSSRRGPEENLRSWAQQRNASATELPWWAKKEKDEINYRSIIAVMTATLLDHAVG